MTVYYSLYDGHGMFVTLSVLLSNVMLVRLTLANKGNLLTYLLTYLLSLIMKNSQQFAELNGVFQLEIGKLEMCRETKIGANVPQTEITCVSQISAGRPHKTSALGRHMFACFTPKYNRMETALSR